MAHPQMIEAVAELRDEQSELLSLLTPLMPEQWALPTPAEPWDIRDQVTHLADFDEVAFDVSTGGPRQINHEAEVAGFDRYTEVIRQKGLQKSPEQMLEWYGANATKLRELFLSKEDPRERVPWGLGMAVRTLVTARLMEHWAHGLDIRSAIGVEPPRTSRLRSIAFLITSAFPYAFRVANVQAPDRTLRVELTSGDDTWTFGPAAADDLITGDALEFCKVGVQRLKRADARTLTTTGPLAELALDNARAFL